MRKQRDLGRLEPGETAGRGDQRLQGELGGGAGLDITRLGQGAGFVVDDGQAAVVQAVDAVGLGADVEVVVGQPEFAAHLARRRLPSGPRQVLELGHQPGRDALEAGPPEGQHARPGQGLAKGLAAAFEQLVEGVFGKAGGVAFEEVVKGLVDHDTTLGRPGVGIDGQQRLEAKQPLGIKRVGVADPGLDIGYRQRPRPGRQWRPGGRRSGRLGDVARPVELVLPIEPRQRRRIGPGHVAAGQEGLDAQQPARGHGGRAIDLVGPRQYHAGSGRRLHEVVRRQADAAFRRGQTEACPHGPAEPGVGSRRRWPGAFVEAAQHDQVGALQPRLQKPPDEKPGMAAMARPHRLAGQQGVE